MARARSSRARGAWPRAAAATLALAFALPLAGCEREPVRDPEPPPAAIYLDPPATPPAQDDGPAGPDAEVGAGPSRPRDPATSGAPDEPPDATPDFKDTLEAIPGERPDGGRDGVAAAGTCENGARAAGESWKVKCNTCTCQADGEVLCTLMACAGAPL